MEEEVEMKTAVPGFGPIRDTVLTCTESDRGGRGNSRGRGSHDTNIWFKTIRTAYYRVGSVSLVSSANSWATFGR